MIPASPSGWRNNSLSFQEQVVFLRSKWAFDKSALGPVGATGLRWMCFIKDTQPFPYAQPQGSKISITESTLQAVKVY